MTLTIFYDGQCPLCVKEMRALKARDECNLLQLEDIGQADFDHRFPDIDRQQANRILHALTADGQLLLGLDVTAAAWSRVGVNAYNWLRWPIIRVIADFCYLRFANNRYGLSWLLTGKARLGTGAGCSGQQCSVTPASEEHKP